MPHAQNKQNEPTPLDSEIGSELDRIDELLESVDAHLDQASHLAELGALAPMFAHEVNNLMTQVGGRAQLALMRPDDPHATARALNLAAQAGAHIAQLAEFFLDAAPTAQATPTAPTTQTSEIPADSRRLRDIHQRALGFLDDTDVETLGFTLIEDEPGIEAGVLPVLLQQVLLNLYINAVRAIRRCPASQHRDHAVRVRVGVLDAAGAACSPWNTTRIRITIQDTGVGMTSDQAARLMGDTASRHPNTHTVNDESPPDARQGHGLGLPICRRLLAEVGGALRCESTPGKGTRMTIIVPAAQAHAPAADRHAA
ncbi:MAG: ATP-binding protein [Phycisphaerales bacterium]